MLNMQMETVICLLLLPLALLTSFRDVESSFSYIAPTNLVQVNF